MANSFVDQVSYISQSTNSTTGNQATVATLIEYFKNFRKVQGSIYIRETKEFFTGIKAFENNNNNKRLSEQFHSEGTNTLSEQEPQLAESSSSEKFKRKRRRMGSLILITERDEELHRNEDIKLDRTLPHTLSGVYAKLFASRLEDSNKTPLSEEPEDTEWMKSKWMGGRGLSVRGKISRLFGNRNKKAETGNSSIGQLENIPIEIDEGDNNSFSNNTISAAAFSRIMPTEFKDAKPTASNSPGNCSKELNLYVQGCNSSKSETAQLENTLFSPHTHRPTLRDIPSIEDLQEGNGSSLNELQELPEIGLVKETNNENIEPGSDENLKLNVHDEIDSHLNSQTSTSLISKCFQSATNLSKGKVHESHNSSFDATNLKSGPSPSNTPGGVSTLKGIFHLKHKTCHNRERQHRFRVRFSSPRNLPIQMNTPVEPIENTEREMAAISEKSFMDATIENNMLDLINDDDDKIDLDDILKGIKDNSKHS